MGQREIFQNKSLGSNCSCGEQQNTTSIQKIRKHHIR